MSLFRCDKVVYRFWYREPTESLKMAFFLFGARLGNLTSPRHANSNNRLTMKKVRLPQ